MPSLIHEPGGRVDPSRSHDRFHIALSLVAAVALAAALGGCGSTGDDDTQASGDAVSTAPGPMMRPGENCLSCHREGGEAGRRVWSAAGTVYPTATSRRTEGVAGVKVTLTDINGKEVVLTTNAVGNFYTAEPLAFDGKAYAFDGRPDEPGKMPRFRIRLDYKGKSREMPYDAPAGSCNACHSSPDPIDARGRIFLPLAPARSPTKPLTRRRTQTDHRHRAGGPLAIRKAV